jgi:hypothetical protein
MAGAGDLVARWLSRALQFLIAVATLVIVVVMVVGAIITQRGWPQTSGTITLTAQARGAPRPVRTATFRII